ncbi:hypothetical protein [Halomonas sp. JS92-SW72]|uniref:hypothetical protein n=1 Tax=Halomonas sp. JS92-SW72 TaxID=2306583 RepID=UPI000E5B1C46|nr:hypothetical protein [Halomonas sp. JS92-SW72]AXY43261.1 hypothetical protein D1793_14155 [Halomonas sp. JS92-SW72]
MKKMTKFALTGLAAGVALAALSPAPCEEGVFYRFASACQAAVGGAQHPVRFPLTAYLILPRRCE